MSNYTAIGLGEILWDVMPQGRKLGGAPANFAYHVNALGGSGIPVSRIGDDALGRETLDELADHGVSTDHISIDPGHPTGTVDAAVDKDGVATYTFPDDVAWDFLAFDENALRLAETADAVCFGTLAQRSDRSRRAIHQFLEAARQALKIYDINLRQDFFGKGRILASLQRADVLKINDDELKIVSALLDLAGDEETCLRRIMEQHALKLAVLTRGGEGSLILSPDNRSDLPGAPTTVVDTIGAGDSFTAAMALGYLHGLPLDAINRHAARVAAHVCGQAGGMPIMPAGLRFNQ